MVKTGNATPNAQRVYEVTSTDLPLHCPLPSMSLWNSHPRVYLPLESSTNGIVRCPYCGTEYRLVTKQNAA